MRRNFFSFVLALVFVLGTVNGDHEAPTNIEVVDIDAEMDENYEEELDNINADYDAGREIIYRVNINRLTDQFIRSMNDSVLLNEPLPLDNVEKKLTQHIFLTLEKGYLTELVLTRRTGDCVLTYRGKIVTINMNLGWAETKFRYNYIMRILLYKRTGILHGNIKNLQMNVVVDFDFDTYEIKLQDLDFQQSGKIELKMKGQLSDWMYNLAIKSVTTICKNLVLKAMELESMKMIERRMKEINGILGKNGNARANERPFSFVNMLTNNRL